MNAKLPNFTLTLKTGEKIEEVLFVAVTLPPRNTLPEFQILFMLMKFNI